MKLFISMILLIVAFGIMAGTGIGERQTKIITWKVGDLGADFRDAYSATALPIWTIPAKTVIYDVSAVVETAVTGDATDFIVGDGDDTDGFLTQGFADATGSLTAGYNSDVYRGAYLTNTATVNTVKYYADADTLDITMVTDTATALTAGEIKFLIDFKRLD